MTEQKISISEMIRTTSTNTNVFLNQVADHIDKLENYIATLEAQIVELHKTESEEVCNDVNM
jgi:phosphoribosylanthranilate isomerase